MSHMMIGIAILLIAFVFDRNYVQPKEDALYGIIFCDRVIQRLQSTEIKLPNTARARLRQIVEKNQKEWMEILGCPPNRVKQERMLAYLLWCVGLFLLVFGFITTFVA